jgi:hypothetical protein
LCSVGLNLQSSTPAPLQEKGICDVLWSDVEWTDIYVARIIKIEEHRRPYHLQDGLIISSQSLCRNLTATMLPFALGKPNMNKIHRYTNIVQDQPISHPHTQKIQRPPRAETCPSPGAGCRHASSCRCGWNLWTSDPWLNCRNIETRRNAIGTIVRIAHVDICRHIRIILSHPLSLLVNTPQMVNTGIYFYY